MIAINGMGSAIAKALIGMLPVGELVHQYEIGRYRDHPPCERFVFLQGHLAGRNLLEHDTDSEAETLRVNFLEVARSCDLILAANDQARIVVIGSESGFSGSYDMAYAGAKAALHLYVETKRIGPGQQLVGIAPSIVGDAGMTTRRIDGRRLAERELAHPKGRFLRAQEVARLIHFLLYQDEGHLTGTVIRLHGGGPTCR